MIGNASDQAQGKRIGEAKELLLRLLGDGPRPVKSIVAEATGAGLSWRTIERAKAELRITARKDGPHNGWTWALPQPGQDRQDCMAGECGGVERVLLSGFRDGFSGIDKALVAFRVQPPFGIDEARWHRAVEDGERFLTKWGAYAADVGWTPGDLFDVPYDGKRGGLAWFLAGDPVRSLGPEHAITTSGRVFDRGERGSQHTMMHYYGRSVRQIRSREP